MSIKLAVSGAALAAALVATVPAAAQSVEDFYKGKTITIVVPFNPGGTTANVAQVMGDHIGQYIPGKPAVQLEFMPGAGGLKGQNYAYNVAPRDGTVLFVPQDSIVVAQHLSPDGVQYDAAKFNWLGVAVPTRHVLMVRKDTGATKIEDLKTKEIFAGSSGAGSETDMYPRMTNGVLGTKMKVVPGFPGGAQEVLVAIESGEMQGSVNSWQAWLRRPDLIEKLTPMLIYGVGREPLLPDVPNILELVADPEGQQIVKFISSIGPVGRGLATPPDVPADRIAALREAFAKTMADPAFQTKMKDLRLPVDGALSGEQAQALIVDALSASPATIDKAKALIAIPQ